MQVFLAQVEQGKDTVCACLRMSAVNLEPCRFMPHRASDTAPPCRLHRQGQSNLFNSLIFLYKSPPKSGELYLGHRGEIGSHFTLEADILHIITDFFQIIFLICVPIF